MFAQFVESLQNIRVDHVEGICEMNTREKITNWTKSIEHPALSAWAVLWKKGLVHLFKTFISEGTCDNRHKPYILGDNKGHHLAKIGKI